MRRRFAVEIPSASFSFEPADIVSRVMSLGAATPIEVLVTANEFPKARAFAENIRAKLEGLDLLRDVQFGQLLDYPTVDFEVDRERAGIMGPGMEDVSKALAPATWSSRFTQLNFWADPNSGVAYQVQVQIPQDRMSALEDVGNISLRPRHDRHDKMEAHKHPDDLLLRNVARITEGTALAEYDRYNMQRYVSVRANVAGEDLGRAAQEVRRALATLDRPQGAEVSIRGQVEPMEGMITGLRHGLLLVVVVIFLLLTANFQSLTLPVAVVFNVPAVLAGVVVSLWLTGTTLNLQSFMGAIMSIGVAVANAILLVTAAERIRLAGTGAIEAGIEGASSRLRPILMTSCAMIAGMLPMALSGGQAGPLARAVLGGLIAATIATLFFLPLIFAVLQNQSSRQATSLDPTDPQSRFYQS